MLPMLFLGLTLVPGDSKLVFDLPGGKPIEKANNLLKKLERFGISMPTATRARKIGETAASSLLPKKQNLISTQLSHTPATAAKYYKAVKGIDRVAEGYSLIQSLGDEANPESNVGSIVMLVTAPGLCKLQKSSVAITAATHIIRSC